MLCYQSHTSMLMLVKAEYLNLHQKLESMAVLSESVVKITEELRWCSQLPLLVLFCPFDGYL